MRGLVYKGIRRFRKKNGIRSDSRRMNMGMNYKRMRNVIMSRKLVRR